jgi:diguanylate cyclase (GGDEF)-like protein
VQGVTVFILGAIISGLVFALVRSIGGARDRAVAMVRETTEELAHQALHDELTGLPNRALLVDRAERMLARRARDGVGDVAALFVDLDNFKSVNDSLGHGAGDAYLRAVGLRLRSELRDADTVGRLGGDEFVVLVEGTTTIGGPPAVADRILHVLAEPIKINGVSLPVSCSVGIASGDHESAEALLDDADLAMYRAKLAGKGRYVVFEPSMRDSARDRLRLGWELREAIGGEGLLLAYRPLLDLRTGRPVGREAFVRWQHPTRGLLDSSTFASIAEECGLNVAMGQWTVREACRQGARRLAAGERARVVVKATDQQLFDDSFVDAIGEALIASDLPPDLLMIEVSENALIPEQEAARARLRGVKDLGVRIAVDDLGVGRASLRYLRHYPVDAVKLDHTLVAELVDSPESQAMVRTLVQVGETRDLEILAEANGAGAGLWELLFSPDASEPEGPDGSDQPPSRSPVVEQPVPHPIDPRTRPSPAAPEWTFEGR